MCTGPQARSPRAARAMLTDMPARRLSAHDDTPVEDNIVVLYDATWADYERLLEIRGDQSAPRICFLEGAIEIMSPSRSHGFIKSVIGSLVETWCLENQNRVQPVRLLDAGQEAQATGSGTG